MELQRELNQPTVSDVAQRQAYVIPSCYEDRVWGKQTRIYLQWYLYCLGYDIMISGNLSKEAIMQTQKFLNTFDGNDISIDGNFGRQTATALERFVEIKLKKYQAADGEFRYINKVILDGTLDGASICALQRVLNMEF